MKKDILFENPKRKITLQTECQGRKPPKQGGGCSVNTE